MGAATVDITPRLEPPMSGYDSERAATEIYDPLYAKAMVLDDGTTKIAIVALDLIKTTREFVVESARRSSRAAGCLSKAS
jgi:hypothetical protein